MGTLFHCRRAPSECQWHDAATSCGFARKSAGQRCYNADRPHRAEKSERAPSLSHVRAHDHSLRRPALARRLGSLGRSRLPRILPIHPRHPANDVPGTAVDDAAVCRVRDRGRIQSAVSVPARPRRERPQRGVRPADADGLRLGPSAGGRRSRPRRRGDRLDRGHGGARRRHPARSRLDVDDDQRHGDHPAGALRRRRAPPGHRRRRRCRARSRTTSSRSTSRAGPTSTRRARRCGLSPTSSPTASASCRNGTRSPSAGITSARPGRRRSKKSPSRSPTRSRTCRRRSRPGSTSIASASGSRSSSTRTTTFSRKSPSSAPRGGCGRGSCANASAPPTRAPSSCASIRRRPAARSPLNSPTTTSSASRCRRWPPCSAGRNRCTATAATKRWRSRPRRRRASRSGRSRSSPRRPASPNTVDPLGGSYAIEALTNEIESGAVALLERIEAAGGTLAAIEQGLIQRAIQESAYRAQQQIDAGREHGRRRQRLRDRCHHEHRGHEPRSRDRAPPGRARPGGPSLPRRQRRGGRPSTRSSPQRAARDNLVPPIVRAVEARATVGEIADAMRSVFGEHKEVDV